MPSKGARCARRSLLENPAGRETEHGKDAQRSWTRGSSERALGEGEQAGAVDGLGNTTVGDLSARDELRAPVG